MTDTSAQEQARAEELLCDLLDYAKATGLPSPNMELDIERVAAALTEATRQGAEEMRERAICEIDGYEVAISGVREGIKRRIRALSLDGGDNG